MSFLRHGNDHSGTDDRDDHCFEVEEILQLMGRREHEWELDAPEHEVGNHFLGGDAGALWKVIWDVEEGGEDGPDYLDVSILVRSS